MVLLAVLTAGCATGSPEARAVYGVYWDAARACQELYRNLRVDRVHDNGDVLISAELDLPRNIVEFTQCYHERIHLALASLRTAGRSLPSVINERPAVDMD